MATAIVDVIDANGETQQCRVFLDPGSDVNFVSQSTVDKLGLQTQQGRVDVGGIGGCHSGTSRGSATVRLFSRVSKFSLSIKALIFPRITGNLPRVNTHADFSHLKGLKLADPKFYISSPVDILLGNSAEAQILLPGLKRGPPGAPIAIKSKFGWFLRGRSTSDSEEESDHFHSHHCSSQQSLEDSLQRFWELEEPFQCDKSQLDTCEADFLSTHSRDPDGRFTVNLPFHSTGQDWGDSRAKAISCFLSTERRLNKFPEVKVEYNLLFSNYLKWG
jgi:hypothetical protein